MPALLPGRPAVRAIEPYNDEVWRVEAEGGHKVVVKQQLFGFLTRGKAFDLLRVECDVLGLLRGAGCPVPAVLGIDEEAQCIFLEWVGDRTLDAAIQAGEQAAARAAVAGLCAIERTLPAHAEKWVSRVAPGVGCDDLAVSWDGVLASAGVGLNRMMQRLGRSFDAAASEALLQQMHGWLAARPPALGSSDYNPHNAVVDSSGTGVHFLEFAKIGWDWTERRLVQYTTSVGSGRADGRMRTLADAESARHYAETFARADGARALDYHKLFFLLQGAAMLCAALDGGPQAGALLSRWQHPQYRLRQFAAMLADDLSDDPLAAEFRQRASLTTEGDAL